MIEKLDFSRVYLFLRSSNLFIRLTSWLRMPQETDEYTLNYRDKRIQRALSYLNVSS
jgi:hypothetical protein